MNSVQEWVTAMKEEMNSLVENDTWELVDCTKNVKVIDNRWVVRTELSADGLAKRFRAPLVATGHVQNAVIYFDETMSPVARYDTVRGVFAVAALERLQLRHFDVKTAFLYGTVQKAVYVCQPEGFDDGSCWVCKNKHSLYGLKQAPRCWNKPLVDSMKNQRLKVSTADPCLPVAYPPPPKFRRYRWSPRSHEQEEPASRLPFVVHCVLIRL